jgi:hypothetical protein
VSNARGSCAASGDNTGECSRLASNSCVSRNVRDTYHIEHSFGAFSHMSRVLIGCMAAVFAATPCAAQHCIGLPDIRSRAASVEGGLQFPDATTVLSAGLNGSLAQGLFGGVAVQRIEVDDVDADATGVSLRIGGEVGTGQSRAVRVCPVVSASLRFGPDGDVFGVDVTTRGRTLALGASVGGAVRMSEQVQLVPFGGASVLQVRAELESEVFTRRTTDTGGALELGVGLEINRVLVLRPSVVVPVGFEADQDAVFGLSVAIGFGERNSRAAPASRPRGPRRR